MKTVIEAQKTGELALKQFLLYAGAVVFLFGLIVLFGDFSDLHISKYRIFFLLTLVGLVVGLGISMIMLIIAKVETVDLYENHAVLHYRYRNQEENIQFKQVKSAKSRWSKLCKSIFLEMYDGEKINFCDTGFSDEDWKKLEQAFTERQ